MAQYKSAYTGPQIDTAIDTVYNLAEVATSGDYNDLINKPSGGGAVSSVNNMTGDVVLTATDVGALPSSTVIPSKVSDLTNDEGYLTEDDLTLATTTEDGLMSSRDKQTLDKLNPNVSKTVSDIYASEFHVINAKRENLVDINILETPHISERIRTSNLLDVSNIIDNAYLTANGTITLSTNDFLGDFIPVSPGQDIYYTGTVGPTTASSVNRRLHVYNSSKVWIKQVSYAGGLRPGQNWSTHGTLPSNAAYVRVSWGTTDYNVMISVGAPAKYEPYYITPFAAITSASFQVSPDDTYADADEYTITVPSSAGDIYGFEYNPVQGKLYATTGHIASYNGETLPGRWWSDRDVYEEGTTPSTGAEVVYNLESANVVEYDITPITVPMFYNINYILVDNGEIINFTYYAETLSVNHLTVQDGATFGETEIFEENVQGWNHAAEDIDLKANSVSPALTGSPTATSPAATAYNDRIATTQYTNAVMSNCIAPFEANLGKASQSYSVGDYLMSAGRLYKVTAAIAVNNAIVVDTNVSITNVATELNLLRSLIS